MTGLQKKDYSEPLSWQGLADFLFGYCCVEYGCAKQECLLSNYFLDFPLTSLSKGGYTVRANSVCILKI